MRYKSTRGDATGKQFTAILLEGLARDGGLYVPERYPSLDLRMLRSWHASGKRGYADVAFHVLSHFIGDMKPSDLRSSVSATYPEANFGSRHVAPVELLEDGIYRMKLRRSDLGIQGPCAPAPREPHAIGTRETRQASQCPRCYIGRHWLCRRLCASREVADESLHALAARAHEPVPGATDVHAPG